MPPFSKFGGAKIRFFSKLSVFIHRLHCFVRCSLAKLVGYSIWHCSTLWLYRTISDNWDKDFFSMNVMCCIIAIYVKIRVAKLWSTNNLILSIFKGPAPYLRHTCAISAPYVDRIWYMLGASFRHSLLDGRRGRGCEDVDVAFGRYGVPVACRC